jgi:predicted metal-dependent peptidase
MDDIALAKAKAEVIAVMDEVQPDFVEIMYADARVARADRFERGEEIVFQPAGGGGTDFRPVFEHVDGMEEKPACIIYITDLYGSFPEGSDIPTLWVTDTDQSAPFGDTLKIE